MSSAPRSRVEHAPPPTSGFEVEIVDEDGWQWRCLSADEIGSIVSAVSTAVAQSATLPAPHVAATLLLSNDAHVQALNRQWRAKDKPTNVLSFPSGEDEAESPDAPLFLGDVVIAEETVVAEAREAGLPVAHHFHHLVLHGLLHLLGFDHETEAEADEMEALETAILARLSIPDPYEGSEPLREGDGARPSELR